MKEPLESTPLLDYRNPSHLPRRTAKGDWILGILMLLAGTALISIAAILLSDLHFPQDLGQPDSWGILGFIGLWGLVAMYLGIVMVRRKKA